MGIDKGHLNEAMEALGINQSELARRAGLSRASISGYLNADSATTPNNSTLKSIAKALGVSVEWIMGEEAPKLNLNNSNTQNLSEETEREKRNSLLNRVQNLSSRELILLDSYAGAVFALGNYGLMALERLCDFNELGQKKSYEVLNKLGRNEKYNRHLPRDLVLRVMHTLENEYLCMVDKEYAALLDISADICYANHLEAETMKAIEAGTQSIETVLLDIFYDWLDKEYNFNNSRDYIKNENIQIKLNLGNMEIWGIADFFKLKDNT